MSRQKLKKFADLKSFDNVLEFGDHKFEQKLKKFIQSADKVILELGCGKGEYSLALAEKNPEYKYLALDIQGERLWHGAKEAMNKKLNNLLFIRFHADFLEKIFLKASIDEIWITFPDPYPRKKQAKKRLVSAQFLKKYQIMLKDKGLIHLKTDDKKLFNFAIKSAKEQNFKISKQIVDIYKQKNLKSELKIKTYFEEKHLLAKKRIHYLKIQKTN
ncbi:MAG: tRNA (guanine-N7-)-methyltransferase [Patescibacteria group bacterium]|nr:tRNA (guanine-N7-)-methyltransferase [Patescibacteria group bacterium]MDQ5970865.1 tRNA (guanine-N7-)-methyltransferase [Patescibacteria group bacterium]